VTQAPPAAPTGRPIDVIEVSGRLDPVVAEFVSRTIRRAEASGGEVVVIQLDSPGSLLGGRALDALTREVARSEVPVAVWIGPSGSVALGDAARLVDAAAAAGMAPGTSVDDPAGAGGRSRPPALGPKSAMARGVVDLDSPTLGDFVVGLDGRQSGDRVLQTARALGRGQRTAAGNVRFAKLDLVEQVLHAAANPQVAYLLLLVGLLLVVFEFFTAGVGVAGGVGAAALVLAAFGLDVLPTTPLGLGLLLVGVVGFAIDVQAGAPRAWSVIGALCLLAGSLRLYGDGVSLPLLTILLVAGGYGVAMVSGMTSMLRARFATPTIGRESMVGQMGVARSAVDPDGTVTLGGAVWRARTNRATPISSGDPIRVVRIDGVLLEVEPEEGGARDAGH